MPSPRPTIAEVDLQAFRHNLHQVKRLIGPAREVFAVIKADAYGHGAVPIGRELEKEGVRFLGVATVEEGIDLREAGIEVPVTVLGGVFPEQHDLLFEWNLSPVLYNPVWAEALSRRAVELGKKIPVQVKVDTGMGRLGLSAREASESIAKMTQLPGLQIEAVLSHFSDADLEDKEFTQEQLRRFLALKDRLAEKGIRFPYWHLSNSAAVMDFPPAMFNLVRPGIMLYGCMPSPTFTADADLRPLLSWRTRIMHLKEVPSGTPLSYGRTYVTRRHSRIATLPVGYADGFSRRLSPGAQVLIRGQRAPVVGRVTMDMILVDVTEIPQTSLGDRVTLIGEDGGERISAWDLAQWSDTIAYEILCCIGRRVPRVYVNRTAGERLQGESPG